MQVNNINFQPNFQAKFKDNEAIKNIAASEISKGRKDELEDALTNLSKHHKNVILEVKSDGFVTDVTNLYNGKKVQLSKMTTDTIGELSNKKSREYKKLFGPDSLPTEKQAKRMTDIIASKYFAASVPDYTLGRKIDASF